MPNAPVEESRAIRDQVMGGSAGRILLAAVAMIPAAGLAQTISINDGTLSFGPQPLGTTSSARLLLVTNSGSAALDITAVTLAGLNDQSFTYPPSTTCIGSLAVAQECSISIAFTPHKVGSLTTRIQIASNATNASSGYSYIDVSGTGVSPTPTVTVSPMSLSFGDEVTGIPSLPQILTVTNTTAGSATISSVGLYGNNNQASFSSPQLSTSCAGALPVEAQCTISLSFMPRATGPLSTEVSIVSQPGHGAIIGIQD